MLRVGREEDVLARVGQLAEGRDHRRLVAVADVVLVAVGEVAAVGLRRQLHVGRVEVGAVLALGQPEPEDRALFEQLRRALLRLLVGAHPDRPQPEDRDLPDVPVVQAVKTYLSFQKTAKK